MSYRSEHVDAREATIHTNASSLPQPTDATGGGAIGALHSNTAEQADQDHELIIDYVSGAGDVTITNPTLQAYDGGDTTWREIAALNGGKVITVNTNKSWSRNGRFIGNYTRLAIVGTLAGGNVTVKVRPIRTTGGE